MSNDIDERRLDQLLMFAASLGVEFKDIELLNRALTHSSYTKQEDSAALNNEKLEFLGDAVLEITTSTYLYKHFPNMSEGELTKARAARSLRSSGSGKCSSSGIPKITSWGGRARQPWKMRLRQWSARCIWIAVGARLNGSLSRN